MSLREPWWRNKVNYINYATQCLSRFSLRKKKMPICQKVQIVHEWHASYAVYKSRGRKLLGNRGNPTANWPSNHSHCKHVSSFGQVKMLWWSEEDSVMSLCLCFTGWQYWLWWHCWWSRLSRTSQMKSGSLWVTHRAGPWWVRQQLILLDVCFKVGMCGRYIWFIFGIMFYIRILFFLHWLFLRFWTI